MEWQALYAAADQFKKAKCWEWMAEDDLFGVKDPESDVIAFCCIMGAGGEHQALAAYSGPAGLNSYLELADPDNDNDDFDKMFSQKCLMGSFEDREMLEKEDLKIIKDLGLRYRGQNQWPVFRSYEPGFSPWFINAAQCRFLTYIFQQALEVSLRVRSNQNLLGAPSQFNFLVRTPAGKQPFSWTDEYHTIEPEPTNYVSVEIANEIMLKKLRSLKTQPGLTLEADVFYLPAPVREEGRPYLPLVAFLLDHNQKMIIGYEMFREIQTQGFRCLDLLVRHIFKIGKLPAKLLVSQERSYYLYEKICGQLGISLERNPKLPLMREVRQGMEDFLNRQSSVRKR